MILQYLIPSATGKRDSRKRKTRYTAWTSLHYHLNILLWHCPLCSNYRQQNENAANFRAVLYSTVIERLNISLQLRGCIYVSSLVFYVTSLPKQKNERFKNRWQALNIHRLPRIELQLRLTSYLYFDKYSFSDWSRPACFNNVSRNQPLVFLYSRKE